MDNLFSSSSLLVIFGIMLFLIAMIVAVVLSSTKKIHRAKQQATVDPITGGLNPTGFYAAAEANFPSQQGFYSVVTMDIRNFYQIYETFGLQESHRVLTHLHTVLKANLAASEPVSRTGGSRFCFLLKNQNEDEIRARLKLIYDHANRFNLQRTDPYRLDLCFGICMRKDLSEPLMGLQEKSAHLLNSRGSEPRYRFYEESVREPRNRRQELLEQVEQSITQRNFVVYLQPQVRLGDRKITGAEALVRCG